MKQTAFIEPIIKSAATISACETYRYTLRRWWRTDSTVCWIMLNPSTANAYKDDPTIRRCIHFTQSWGYGGLVVVNLFPFRSSSPSACRQWWKGFMDGNDWYARDAFHNNLAYVQRAAKKADLVVAAWGAGDWYQNEAEFVTEEVQSDVAPWPDIHCLGTNQADRPLHPMARGKHRVPDIQTPILWRKA